MQEQLDISDIMKMMRRTWILVGIVGLVLIVFSNVFSNLEFSFSFVIIGLGGGLITLIRLRSLKAEGNVSQRTVVMSTILGAIITAICTGLFLYIFIIVGVTTGFLAQ